MFQGENKIFRKTEMCRAFASGNCHWGIQCNHAHTGKELQTALTALHEAGLTLKKFPANQSTAPTPHVVSEILTFFFTLQIGLRGAPDNTLSNP